MTTFAGLYRVSQTAGTLDYNAVRLQVKACSLVVLDNLPEESHAVYVALSDTVHPLFGEDVLLKGPQSLVVFVVDWA